MACSSSKPLEALSSHLQSACHVADGPSVDHALNFRFERERSLLEEGWHAFCAPQPRSQIQALPPFATWDDEEPIDWDDHLAWTEQFAAQCRDNDEEDYKLFLDPSARWSPEVETALQISRQSTISPTGSSSSYTSTLPTPDEAAKICCDHGKSFWKVCCARAQGQLLRSEGSDSPHPLTFHPDVGTEWDFERLLSRRRCWRDGKRTASAAVDVDEPPDTKSSQVGDGGVQMHEALRDVALGRLALIVGHLMGSSAGE